MDLANLLMTLLSEIGIVLIFLLLRHVKNLIDLEQELLNFPRVFGALLVSSSSQGVFKSLLGSFILSDSS